MALATLTIDIDARMASLEKDMGKVVQLSEQTATRMQGAFDKAGLSLGKLIGGFSAAAIIGFAKSVPEAIDALNDVVDVTGSTIENISSLEQVALKTGASLDTVATAMVKFNQVLNEAKPNSQAELDLKAIGLSVEDLKKQDPADALITVAQALSGFADDATKARLVQDLLGKSVREIGPYLKDLADSGKVNATVTSDQAKEAEKFTKHLAEMETRSKNAARALAGDLLPAINRLFERKESGGFMALFGFDQKFFDTAKVGQAAAEVNSLNSLRETFENGLRADPTNRAYAQRLEEVNAQLKQAKANFKALYAESSLSAPKELMGPPVPPPAPPPTPKPADAEALRKAAEDARKAQDAYDKLISSIKEKVKAQEQEIALGRPLTDAESFYLQSNKQIEEQTKTLTPALKKSAIAFLERQRAVLLSNQAQIAGAAASARNAQGYLTEADSSRKATEQLLAELGLMGRTATEQQALTDARARDIDVRALDRAEALLTFANSDAEREALTRLTDSLKAQIAVRDQISSKRKSDAEDPTAGAGRAVDEYLEKVKAAGNATHDAVANAMGKLEDSLTEFAATGKTDIADLVNSIIKEFLRLQVIQPLMANILGGSGGGSGSGASGFMSLVGSFFGASGGGASSFGGAFANGGDPPVGKASLVGEVGPELFIPKTAGTIIPNKLLQGAGGGAAPINVTVHQQISVGDGVSRSEVQSAMRIAKDQAKSEILQSIRNRGPYAQ